LSLDKRKDSGVSIIDQGEFPFTTARQLQPKWLTEFVNWIPPIIPPLTSIYTCLGFQVYTINLGTFTFLARYNKSRNIIHISQIGNLLTCLH